MAAIRDGDGLSIHEEAVNDYPHSTSGVDTKCHLKYNIT
jgi:hypothetical protein